MIFYNIIYAHGIHTGGGLTLLKKVLAAVSKSPDYKFILDSRIRDEVSKYNLTYVDYFEPGILGRIRSELRLRKYGSEVTKVLSFNSLPFFLPLKYPITMFFQNVNLIYSTRNSGFLAYFKSRFFRFHASNVDEFIVQSATVQNILSAVTDRPSSIMTLLDISQLLSNSLSERNLITEGVKFIYVADDSDHKNHLVLFQAWSLIKRIFPDFKMELVVTIPYYTKGDFGRYSGEFDYAGLCIKNIGYVQQSELFDWYNRCDAMINPSLSESLSLPLVEAQFFDLDIIASELDYVRDICIPVETFDPQSAVSIARALARYLDLPWPQSVCPTTPGDLLERVFG